MSSTKKVYKVTNDGSITGLWSDVLANICGDKAVSRASEVEFDNSRGGWTIKFLVGPMEGETVPKVFTTREEALSVEAALLNNWIKKGMVNGEETQ